MDTFQYLVRFRDTAGAVFYGEAGPPAAGQIHSQATLVGREVPVFGGTDPWDPAFALSGASRSIAEVLAPLAHTPLFVCIGLNYKQHAAEANMSYGTYPTVFTKPPDALAGPYEDVPIHPSCAELDYEAELAFVLKQDIKNWDGADGAAASDVILGYASSNDVSSRWWQKPARSNGQHAVAKSFDKFAPVGPVLASPRVVPDPTVLRMECFVNGARRQSTLIDDQIYDIPTVLRSISRGTTIRKGTIVMTGTPSGVAAFMSPPGWLQDGDQVTVRVEHIGEICNKMAFEK